MILTASAVGCVEREDFYCFRCHEYGYADSYWADFLARYTPESRQGQGICKTWTTEVAASVKGRSGGIHFWEGGSFWWHGVRSTYWQNPEDCKAHGVFTRHFYVMYSCGYLLFFCFILLCYCRGSTTSVITMKHVSPLFR